MKIILLSGGSGKRLWPLSNSKRSKQYLSVLEGPDGHMESMLQRLWRQLKEANLQEHTRIATCRQQAEVVQRQVGESAPLIIEPEQRDSFPAAALAAAYLYSIAGAALNETIIVIPVDTYVESDFFTYVRHIPNLYRQSKSEMIMVGIRPSYPAEQYSYIIPEKNHYSHASAGLAAQNVKVLKERPFEAEAEAWIREGALWNSGIYVFQLHFMISSLIAHGMPIHYDELYKQYCKLSKSSFESEISQKLSSISVICYDGAWKDLGSWRSLSEEITFQRLGMGELSDDCEQCQLINELDIPITVVGLKNVIVAASLDGILVTTKDSGSILHEKLQKMNERPKYEERRWGHAKTIDSTISASGEQVIIRRVFIAAGQNFSYHMHFKRKEVWTIVSGEGLLIQDEVYRSVAIGDAVQIPERSRHSLRAATDMELIEVQTGSSIQDDDTIRLGHTWEEITSQYNWV